MSEQTTPSKKISVGLILSWIFGVLFALTGIVSVFSEPIPGLVMLIMAAVLLPPVTKLVDQKWKFHLSSGMKIVVIIIGLIIFGATITGRYIAANLRNKVSDIIMLEEDKLIAEQIAGELQNVRVINGSAADADILNESGVEAADVFIATTKNDHSNIISAVLAKKLGAKITVITTEQPEYLSIANALNVDAIISPHQLAVQQILRLARGKGISAITKLIESESEALEFINTENAEVTKNAIKNIRFPKDSIIGAVYHGDQAVLANGDTHINAGEKVIVFCRSEAVKRLQQMFTSP